MLTLLTKRPHHSGGHSRIEHPFVIGHAFRREDTDLLCSPQTSLRQQNSAARRTWIFLDDVCMAGPLDRLPALLQRGRSHGRTPRSCFEGEKRQRGPAEFELGVSGRVSGARPAAGRGACQVSCFCALEGTARPRGDSLPRTGPPKKSPPNGLASMDRP